MTRNHWFTPPNRPTDTGGGTVYVLPPKRRDLARALGFEPGDFHGDDAIQAVLDVLQQAEELTATLDGLREWLAREERHGATVVRISTVRRILGWPA